MRDIVLLPGMNRTAAFLADAMRSYLPSMQALDIPSQGTVAPIPDMTIAGLTEHFARQITRDALVVGESLGGLVALGLAGRGYDVVAIEPPLQTANCWPLHKLRETVDQHPHRAAYGQLIGNVFGILPNLQTTVCDHFSLLDDVKSPVLIVAGDVPYWPPDIDKGFPSALDEQDLDRARAYPVVEAVQIEGPHDLLIKRPDACRSLIEAWILKAAERSSELGWADER